MKALLVCLLLAVSIFSFGCAGTSGGGGDSGDRPSRWSSVDVEQAG